MLIRAATTHDMPAVQSIYAHHVLHGLGTFETEPPDAAEMRARFDSITASGFPYLVADDAAGRVVGYAYANHFRTRAAYRYTVEDSIYVAPEAMGRGFGKLLLQQLMHKVHRARAARDARGHRRLGQRGFDRRAPRLRLHTRRHDDRYRPQVRSLGRRRRHATHAGARRQRLNVARLTGRARAPGPARPTHRCAALLRASSAPCRVWRAGIPMSYSG